MDLKNKTLEEWLKTAPKSKYKYGNKVEYFRNYNNLKDFCETNVHKHISLGANLKDGKLFLNDHGIDHVNTVIKRASELVSSEHCELSAKEVFYLLCAIQLHDVGNIFGRYKHEINSKEIVKQCGFLFSADTTEQHLIWKIAKAHGGKDELTGKDTIISLKPYNNMDSVPVKTQLIASIIRIADELADDKNRAARWPLENNIVPEDSKIYHEFSLSLNSVTIKHEEHSIDLDFYIQETKLNQSYMKDNKDIFLIDEIYERILKMHLERIYCMRFMRRFIDLDKIHAKIEFVPQYLGEKEKPFPLELTVAEAGYPEKPTNGIFDICPELSKEGIKYDGNYFAALMKGTT